MLLVKFSERMKDLRKNRGWTQDELAKRMGVSKSCISMYECDMRTPDFKTLESLADFFNVDIDYLTGRKNTTTSLSDATGVRIPVFGRVAAGIPLEAVEEIIDYEEIPAEMTRSGEYFGLKITGQSMEPRILDGDVVIVRKQDEVENGDIAIVLVNGNDATCKKFIKHENGVSLLPLNPSFSPQFYNAEECEQLPLRVIGKVVELRGKFN